MGPLRRLRAWWTARRLQLAMKQIEAERGAPGLAERELRTDSTAGMHYASRRALGRMLNTKAKSRTEWRGD